MNYYNAVLSLKRFISAIVVLLKILEPFELLLSLLNISMGFLLLGKTVKFDT